MTSAPSDLAERLGAAPGQRLILVTADGLGTSHAANAGVTRSVHDGLATGASLVVPGPWSLHASRIHRGEPVGVALTVTADHDHYRWGPVTAAPSLLGGEGGFPRTVVDLWDHADLDELRRECRIQIERAVLWGFDVTHIASHRDALTQRPEFFDTYLDLALELGLPARLPDQRSCEALGFPIRRLAADEGLIAPDRVVHLSEADDAELAETVGALEPGVTELVLRPAEPCAELAAIDERHGDRSRDLDRMSPWGGLARSLSEIDAKVISWPMLRALAR